MLQISYHKKRLGYIGKQLPSFPALNIEELLLYKKWENKQLTKNELDDIGNAIDFLKSIRTGHFIVENSAKNKSISTSWSVIKVYNNARKAYKNSLLINIPFIDVINTSINTLSLIRNEETDDLIEDDINLTYQFFKALLVLSLPSKKTFYD